MTNRLIEEKRLSETNRYWLKPSFDSHVFRYCEFEGLDSLEERFGASIDSCFLNCRFSDCAWDDPFFNVAPFFEVTFERCTFNGASFRGCSFVACTFEDCRFECCAGGSPIIFDD